MTPLSDTELIQRLLLAAVIGGLLGAERELRRKSAGFRTNILIALGAAVFTMAGLALTPAGATWPYGRDPYDRTLRLAPTFPPLEDVRDASEGIAICILLAAIEKHCAAKVE